MFRRNHRVNFFLTFCTEARKTKGGWNSVLCDVFSFLHYGTIAAGSRVRERCQQTLTGSVKMFRFQLKLNMLPVPLTLSTSLCLTLVPWASWNPLSCDPENLLQRNPPNLKKKFKFKKSGAFFFFFYWLCTVPITLSSWLHCFNLGGIL